MLNPLSIHMSEKRQNQNYSINKLLKFGTFLEPSSRLPVNGLDFSLLTPYDSYGGAVTLAYRGHIWSHETFMNCFQPEMTSKK